METAVDFLYKEINNIRLEDECGNLSALDFFNAQNKAFEKAKKLEKEQTKEHFENGFKRAKTALLSNYRHYSKIYFDNLNYIPKK